MNCQSFGKRIIPFAIAVIVGVTGVSLITSYYYQSRILSFVLKQQPIFLKKPVPKWTKEAIANKTQGTVILKVTFDEWGKFRSAEVIEGLPFGLTENALEAAKETEVEQYKFLNNNISISTKIHYNFKLNN